jgi:hypothetical protein
MLYVIDEVFKRMVERKPYGNVETEKPECITHAQDRLGSCIHRLHEDYKEKQENTDRTNSSTFFELFYNTI